jgi:hypothetical protein
MSESRRNPKSEEILMKTKSTQPNPVQHLHALAFVFGTLAIAVAVTWGRTLG